MRIVLFLSLLFLGSVSRADDNCGWSAGAGLGLAIPTSSTVFKDAADPGLAGSLILRKGLCSLFSVQLDLDKSTFGSVDANNTDLGVSGLYHFNLNQMRPYVGLGLGYTTWDDIAADTVNKLSGKLEAGLDYWFSQNLAFNAAIKYQYVDTSSDAGGRTQVVTPRVGLIYKFGGTSDSTQSVSKANKTTSAAVVPVAAQDLDSDSDGVLDSVDKCKNTVSGAKVNAYGCAEKEKATVKVDVKFQTGSSVLDKNQLADIKDLAEFMVKHPTTKVVINGHTDNTGSRNGNINISMARATAVKNMLVNDFKISSSRLTAKGLGPDQPIVDNLTEENRSINRRVEADIIE